MAISIYAIISWYPNPKICNFMLYYSVVCFLIKRIVTIIHCSIYLTIKYKSYIFIGSIPLLVNYSNTPRYRPPSSQCLVTDIGFVKYADFIYLMVVMSQRKVSRALN